MLPSEYIRTSIKSLFALNQFYNLQMFEQKHWTELRKELIELRQKSFDLEKWWNQEKEDRAKEQEISRMPKMGKKKMEEKENQMRKKKNLQRNNELKNGQECIICMDEKIEFINRTCGHKSLGANCAAKITICPLCKAEGTYMKVFEVV